MSLPNKFITIKSPTLEEINKRIKEMEKREHVLIDGPISRFDGFSRNVYYAKLEFSRHNE